MDSTYDLIGFLAAIIALFCIAGWYTINVYLKADDEQERYLRKMYNDIWTGHPLDRVHAWYRVIQHLKVWNQDAELISRARQLMHLEKDLVRQERRGDDSEAWVVNSGSGVRRKVQVFRIEELT